MFIRRDRIDKLARDMINWRDLAHENYTLAKDVQKGYLDQAKERGQSTIDAEARSSKDTRFVNAVANNQMYDRFATRDAAVLTALMSMATAGLLEVRPLIDDHTHRASCHGEAGELICERT